MSSGNGMDYQATIDMEWEKFNHWLTNRPSMLKPPKNFDVWLGAKSEEMRTVLQSCEDVYQALRAADALLLSKQAELLRECRIALNFTLEVHPTLDTLLLPNQRTLGELRKELHEV